MPTAWTHGSELKRFREERKLSQRAAAALVGVAEQAYGNWERGKQEPSLENKLRLVEKLGAPPEAVGYEPPSGWELVPSAWIRQHFADTNEKLDQILHKLDRLPRR